MANWLWSVESDALVMKIEQRERCGETRRYFDNSRGFDVTSLSN